MPKVSVLMPVYNTKEEYLRGAIESILTQTFTDFELLIMNDGSTDKNVDKVVKSYRDVRIKYVNNEKNSGISKVRNALIEASIGQYLAIMDHDDISLPARIEKQVAYLDDHADVGVVSCYEDQFPCKKRVSRNPVDDAAIRIALMRECAITHPAAMIRKSVLVDNNVMYEEEFSPAEDYALWCRLIPYTQFHNIPEVLFMCRQHQTNTSRTQGKKINDATLAIHAFVGFDNPVLHKKFMLFATHIDRVRLFGFIPFLRIVSKGYRKKVYLFERVLLYTAKNTIKLKNG